MGDPDLKVEETRALIAKVRQHADATATVIPLARGLVAVETMRESQIADVTDQLAPALDEVVNYHVTRLRDFADRTEQAVAAFVRQEDASAAELRQARPR
ncbi:hypothetical protein [Nocardia harenae]|uniref:hypothetical protein n=1 Tax=Nocardia harenae TaxID=358707 RepID=UPI000830FD15|nr:hypothetical protein [Nocardia harenae]